MSENLEDANSELVAAVQRYMEQMDWTHPDLMLTDVVVVAVSRGFDHIGSKSRTTTIVPTDSAVPLLLGMARYAEMRFEKIVADSLTDLEEK